MSDIPGYDATEHRNGLLMMMEMMSVNLELVTGYKEKCEAAGFSPTIAEGMAAELHSGLMASVFRQQ